MSNGIRVGADAAWGSGLLTPRGLKRIGASFVVGYVSPDASKNIPVTEVRRLHAAGIDVVLVWEYGAHDARGGHAAGVAAAQAATVQADVIARAIGHTNWPVVYFAPFDDDAAPSDQPEIDDFLRGVAEYRGPRRAGGYLGYWPLKRAADAGVGIDYWWQTYAWSGGQRDPRARLYQYSNGHRIDGVSCDFNQALAPDFGQLPRIAPPQRASGVFNAEVTYDHDRKRVTVTPKAGHVRGWGDVSERIALELDLQVGGRNPRRGQWTGQVIGAKEP